ncbi:hypothetical protein C5Q97_05250 [Victivallales bacterium CCUG 44730]|nr:hypothetical protein C5Q97_05250 [Victivallales bacterium CCUG 44730]
MVLSTQRQTLSCGPVYSVESSGPVLSASGTGAFRVSQAGIVHAGGVAAIAVNGGCPRGAAVVSVSVTFRRLLYRFVGSCLRELTGVCIVASALKGRAVRRGRGGVRHLPVRFFREGGVSLPAGRLRL